ncbi:MAG TPA: type I restriction-modification system subunit M N-terminal domain-containing protein [Vicinamibacteria bacterium]
MGKKKSKVLRTDADNLVSNLRGEVGEIITTWLLMRDLMSQAARLASGEVEKDMRNRELLFLNLLADKLRDELIGRLSELAESKIGQLTFQFTAQKLRAFEREAQEFAAFIVRHRLRDKRNRDISHKQLPEQWSDHRNIDIPYRILVRAVALALRLMKRIDRRVLGPAAPYSWREARKRRYSFMSPPRAGYMLLPSEIVSFLWGIADLIRDTFKRGKYQDVILPLTVLRRLDCVLAPTKEKVLRRQAELRDKKLENLDAQLRKASGFAFYNTSRYDFEKLLADAPHLAANLRNYIAGFSLNMREVLEKFDFDNTISKLDEAGLLFQVLERFKNVDLHPEKIDNPTMGTIFEELIRKFNEALNENPGEHFTPRDVVHLLVDLMLAGDQDRIRRKGVVCTVYDPCCGSGGMLMITKEHITVGLRRNSEIIRAPFNPGAEIHLFRPAPRSSRGTPAAARAKSAASSSSTTSSRRSSLSRSSSSTTRESQPTSGS